MTPQDLENVCMILRKRVAPQDAEEGVALIALVGRIRQFHEAGTKALRQLAAEKKGGDEPPPKEPNASSTAA